MNPIYPGYSDVFASNSVPLPVKTPKLFALLIGIDEYAESETKGFKNLNGAVADAQAVKNYLEYSLAVPDSQIKTLYNNQATRKEIIQAIKDLGSKENGIDNGNPILIYFAGHGGEQKKPEKWKINGSVVQILVPHDYGKSGDQSSVQGIPDITLNTLLEQLAKEKGDNITVILDCCYSSPKILDVSAPFQDRDCRQTRSIKIEEDVIDSLDDDIWGSNTQEGMRSSEIPSGFRYKDMRSHVLLSACGRKEQAMEDMRRGEFTRTLLETLVSTSGRISYSDLLSRLDPLPQQTPQCEGFHKGRLLWNSMAIDTSLRLFKVRRKDESYILEAGTAHGVTTMAEFTVYQEIDNYPSKDLGFLTVRSTDLLTSTLAPPSSSSTEDTTDTMPRLEPPTFAVLKKTGVEEDVRVHVKNSRIVQLFANTLDEEGQQPHHRQTQIVFAEKSKAQLALDIEREYVTFEILDPFVTRYNLCRIPFRVKPDILPSVLQSAARFHRNLRRKISIRAEKLQTSVHLEFTKLTKRNGRIQVDGSNLNVRGRIDLVVGGEKYGIKLVNKSNEELYPYLFFFDCSDLSVECYYDAAESRVRRGSAPLPPRASLTIGYTEGGWSPWSYSLRQPKSIQNGLVMQDHQDVDVGFLKLFLSIHPLNFSEMEQPSPFLSPFIPRSREGMKESLEIVGTCESRIITVIQRKLPLILD
ncbi:hypothetical protein M408DRAFT_25453 [Serendipita vermifera MAFF 305830]|uniref:Peptidase C14 caspase domain-containing protein n=1 Tax=Serendipita vermifera MAFF 305830 TaxID=933852 RepID=A0A0C3B427_SERVB|nr:hypothetical protein M408DRAFT_25453 [Serendipita vermifera MAFF 305830]